MLLSLIKKEFMALLNSFKGGGRRKSGSTLFSAGFIIAFLFFIGYFLFISTMFSSSVATDLMAIGDIDLLPLLMMVLSCLSTLFFTVFMSGSVLFVFKDFDLLVSLPIKFSTIISAKILYLYITNLLFQVILLGPAVVVWIINASPDVLSLLLALLSFPFVTLIPIVVASFLGTIITFIGSLFSKPMVVSTIINLLLVLVLIGFSFYINFFMGSSTGTAFGNIAVALRDDLFSSYPPALFYYNLLSGDLIAFAMFVLLSLGIFGAFSWLVSKQFINIRTRLTSHSTTVKTTDIKVSSGGAFGALLKKEWNMLVSIPIYATNMLTGLIMGVLLCGSAVFFSLSSETLAILTAVSDLTEPVAPAVLSFFVAYVSTSSCSVSLEGEHVWLMKSLPHSAGVGLLAKVYFNLVLHLPFSLVFSSCIVYALRPNLLWSVLCFVVPVIMCVFNSYLGLLLNLRFPQLDWDNPALPVKRGAPVMISVFFNMALYMGMGYLAFLVLDTAYQPLLYIAVSVVAALLSILAHLYIKRNSHNILLDL